MASLLTTLKQLGRPSALRQVWPYLKSLPRGGALLGRVIGRMAPYTGTIRPEVVELDTGHAKIRMADAKRVRNHLQSVHAIALMNLGEVATGTAMLYSLPDDARGIITNLSMEYLKKARGPITAECRCEVPQSSERQEYEVHADLTDEAGEVVARAHAKWLIGPA